MDNVSCDRVYMLILSKPNSPYKFICSVVGEKTPCAAALKLLDPGYIANDENDEGLLGLSAGQVASVKGILATVMSALKCDADMSRALLQPVNAQYLNGYKPDGTPLDEDSLAHVCRLVIARLQAGLTGYEDWDYRLQLMGTEDAIAIRKSSVWNYNYCRYYIYRRCYYFYYHYMYYHYYRFYTHYSVCG